MRIETLEQAKELEDGQKVRACYDGNVFTGEVYINNYKHTVMAVVGKYGQHVGLPGAVPRDEHKDSRYTWFMDSEGNLQRIDWVETIEEFKYEVGDVLRSSYYSYELQVLSRFRHNEKEYYATSGCEPVELYTLDELDREGYKLKKETLEIDGKEYDIQEIKESIEPIN